MLTFSSTVDESFPDQSYASSPDTNVSNESTQDNIDLRERKRRSFESIAAPNESIDLTDVSFEISPPKRSRRAADKVVSSIIDTVEIDDAQTTRTRSERITNKAFAGNKDKKAPVKAPKTKRMTYKQALALLDAPIPSSPDEILKPIEATSHRAARIAARSVATASAVDSCDIDLTGDVVLTDKHSSAPLFQKSTPIENKIVKSGDSDSDEDLLNFDVDSVRIKVKMNGKIQAYNYKRYQRYYDVYKIISEQENVPIRRIFLFDHDKRLLYDDTPNSTGYKVSTFLSCRVCDKDLGDYPTTSAKNQIVIKFQSDKWKKPIAVKISKFDCLKTAIDVLCQQMPQFSQNQFSLQFDGDDISVNDTPIDLDFDGGEIIDCRVKV